MSASSGRHRRPTSRANLPLSATLVLAADLVGSGVLIAAGPTGWSLAVRGGLVTAALLATLGLLLAMHGLSRVDEDLVDQTELTSRAVGALRRELVGLRAETGALATSYDEMSRRLSVTTDDLSGMHADHGLLLERLSDLLARHEHASAVMSRLSDATGAEIRATRAEIRAARAELSTARAELSATHGDVAGLHDRADSMQSTVDALHTLLESMRAELGGTARQLAALRAEQEGRADVGQASAVRMTLPLVRAALRTDVANGALGPSVAEPPSGEHTAAPRGE